MSRFISVAILVAVASASQLARAGEESEGERLFREGRALMLDGRFVEACPKLETSQRLEPHTGTLLNLAACNERLGKVASAWIEYQLALTAARAEGQADRVDLARRRIDVLEPRVPWLTVDVRDAAPGLVVTLDDSAIRPVAFGREMPVDPGRHVVGATAPEHRGFETGVELHEGERRVVVVDPLEGTLPRQQTLVVDGADRPVPPPPPEERSRVVFEVGPMIGYLNVAGQDARRASFVEIQRSGVQGAPVTTCDSCTVDVTNGGMLLGATLFGGWALTDRTTIGARFVGAGRASEGGGMLLAGGPGISYLVAQPLRIGVWVLAGTAIASGQKRVNAPNGYDVVQSGGETASGSTDISGGAGADIGFELGRIGNGAIEFTATPLFMVGPQGRAWGTPLGLTWRSR